MKSIVIENPSHLEKYLTTNKYTLSDEIVRSIENAFREEKKVASVLEVHFSAEDSVHIPYMVTIDQKDWENTLKTCIEVFREKEETDKCIDTWKLLKLINSNED